MHEKVDLFLLTSTLEEPISLEKSYKDHNFFVLLEQCQCAHPDFCSIHIVLLHLLDASNIH